MYGGGEGDEAERAKVGKEDDSRKGVRDVRR